MRFFRRDVPTTYATQHSAVEMQESTKKPNAIQHDMVAQTAPIHATKPSTERENTYFGRQAERLIKVIKKFTTDSNTGNVYSLLIDNNLKKPTEATTDTTQDETQTTAEGADNEVSVYDAIEMLKDPNILNAFITSLAKIQGFEEPVKKLMATYAFKKLLAGDHAIPAAQTIASEGFFDSMRDLRDAVTIDTAWEQEKKLYSKTIRKLHDIIIEVSEDAGDEEVGKRVDQLILKHGLGTQASTSSSIYLDYQRIMRKFKDGTLNAFIDELDKIEDFQKPIAELMEEKVFQDLRKRKPEPDQDKKSADSDEDEEEKKRRLSNGSSQNYVTHVEKEADWSPLISSTADASFVMLMALCVTNGGFLALVLLGIRYWNKTENVITKEGSDGLDTNQKTPTAADEVMKQLQASQNAQTSQGANGGNVATKAPGLANPSDHTAAEGGPNSTVGKPNATQHDRSAIGKK